MCTTSFFVHSNPAQRSPCASVITVVRHWTLALVALGALVALAIAPTAAWADRFGPPWMARVTAEQTAVRAEPTQDSSVVGALPRDAIVVVVEERDEWTRVPDGWLPSADVAESFEPWLAQVNGKVAVYAYPNPGREIRRTANPDDLLLVTGVARGVDGDESLWWATTDGYVPLSAVRQANRDLTLDWHRPAAAEAPQGWWARAKSANVRVAPSTSG